MKILNNQYLFATGIHSAFLVFLFLFSLGQLQKITLSVGSLYIHDLIIGAVLIVSFVLHAHTYRQIAQKVVTFSKNNIPLTVCIVFICFRTLFEGLASSNLTPFLYIGRLFTYSLFSMYISSILKPKTITMSWLITICAILYLGMIQFLLLPDIRFLAILGWDDHYYRLISTLFDPAFTGLTFVFGILTLLQNESTKKYRLLLITFFSIGLTLTYSRSSWLALLIALVYVSLYQIHKKIPVKSILFQPLFILIIMSITFLLAPKPGGEGINVMRTSSIDARLINVTTHITESTMSTYIIGDGLFVKEATPTLVPYHPKVPDNIFILMLKGGGIISLVLGVIGLIKMICSNGFRRPIRNSLLIGLLIHSFFSASIIHPFIFLLFVGLYNSQVNEK